MADETRFHFPGLNRGEFLGFIRHGQVLVGAVGLGVLMFGGVVLHSNWPVMLGAILGVAVVAFLPLQGRTMEQWAPLVVPWAARRMTGRTEWRTPAPWKNHRVIFARTKELVLPPECKPPALAHLEILAADWGFDESLGGELSWGVIKNRKAKTYSATLVARGDSFGLEDSERQADRQRAWAAVQSAYGRRSPIESIRWIERQIPDQGEGPIAYLREREEDSREAPALARESYRHLLETESTIGWQHEVLVTITISARRAWRQMQRRGDGNLDRGACLMLANEASNLKLLLEQAELQVSPLMTARELAQAIRAAYDPSARHRRNQLARNGGPEGPHPANAWPRYMGEHLRHFETEGALHRTYWISEWPRTDVGPGFLSPAILQTACLRAIAVELLPMSMTKARTVQRRAQVKSVTDAESRRKAQFVETSEHRRAQRDVDERGDEIAEGHAALEFRGWITVTADDVDQLEHACVDVEERASQAVLDLEPMDGRHERAFLETLPLPL